MRLLHNTFLGVLSTSLFSLTGSFFRARALTSNGHQRLLDSATVPTVEQVLPQTAETSSAQQASGNDLQDLIKLYTKGDLLKEVQLREVYKDSKTFVDLPLKKGKTAALTIGAFNDLTKKHSSNASQIPLNELKDFLNEHFDEPGKDLKKVTPPDFSGSRIPSSIAAIVNKEYREWAKKIHGIWPSLARVHDTSVVSSFIAAKEITNTKHSEVFKRSTPGGNIFIIPGGRFREFYYWDSYWVIKGLLVSEMYTTARSVVNNLLEYVNEYGMVFNGPRVYYINRSQPPFLSDMVRLVARKFDSESKEWDTEYLAAVVELLDKEYAFWMALEPITNPVTGAQIQSHKTPLFVGPKDKLYSLNRYECETTDPRPESFREDYNLAVKSFGPPTTKNFQEYSTLFSNICTTAESGWDFTSRFMKDYKHRNTLRTTIIVPVELNSYMLRMENNLAEFYGVLKNEKMQKMYQGKAKTRKIAMEALFWIEEKGCWKDCTFQPPSSYTYYDHSAMSDYLPMFAGVLDDAPEERKNKVVQSLLNSGLVQNGGFDTTNVTSGEQWDSPNGWAPLVSMMIEGLLRLKTDAATKLASKMTKAWLKNGYDAFKKTGYMFEKYDTVNPGATGTGGEYTPQTGFGWSNGVILDLLANYPKLYEE